MSVPETATAEPAARGRSILWRVGWVAVIGGGLIFTIRSNLRLIDVRRTHQRLADEVGRLVVKDPEGVTIIRVPDPAVPEILPRGARLWRFRIHLPPNYRPVMFHQNGFIAADGWVSDGTGGWGGGGAIEDPAGSEGTLTICTWPQPDGRMRCDMNVRFPDRTFKSKSIVDALAEGDEPISLEHVLGSPHDEKRRIEATRTELIELVRLVNLRETRSIKVGGRPRELHPGVYIGFADAKALTRWETLRSGGEVDDRERNE